MLPAHARPAISLVRMGTWHTMHFTILVYSSGGTVADSTF